MTMACEATKLFSAYLDDALTLPLRVSVDEHLNACPVCRARLAEMRALKLRLSTLSRPVAPSKLGRSITEALAIERAARRTAPERSIGMRLAQWLEPRLMPYTIGSFASVILFVCMFSALRPHFVALHEAAMQSRAESGRVIMIDEFLDLTKPVPPMSPEDFVAKRGDAALESPSLNPSGALAALTRTYSSPRTQAYEGADDMVVVADVFSNGSASLAGIVQPPRDRRMLADFESALRRDAAFVPASLDRRPDTMRVVFSVQKVDVRDRSF
jgi:Putative zinc-finger